MIRKHELPILEYDDASPEVLRPTTTGSARNRERSSTALMVGRRHCSWCSAFRSGWNRKMDKTKAPPAGNALCGRRWLFNGEKLRTGSAE